MQSIFRLPWSSDQIAPKMQMGKAAMENMRAAPVTDVAMLDKLKRKRTDSPEPFSPQRVHSIKKQRVDGEAFRQSPPAVARLPIKSEREPVQLPAQYDDRNRSSSPLDYQSTMSHSPKSVIKQDLDTATGGQIIHAPGASSTVPETSSKDMASDVDMTDVQSPPQAAAYLTPLQQVIENEFNMQILMKHNELRLIEQELAKCQIALEQLRRCELRPYPGAVQLSPTVSAGTGPSILPHSGYTHPSHAAPRGVTDGPYSRHYRQWLLHDPQFESAPMQAMHYADNTLSADMRSTRTASTARKSVHKPSVSMSAAFEVPKSLPNYPATSRKNKIALVKRSTDGQLVKLVCNHCHRSDFSNSQGFLNHCRIAHKVDYKSHDLAAIDCGQVLDEHELANVPPEAHAAPVPKPVASRSSSTTTTPFKVSTFVHPMNNAGSVLSSSSSAPSSAARRVAPKAVSRIVPPMGGAATFQASAQAPRLSAQFAKYNMGGNLEEAITKAKQKIDLSSDEVLSPDLIDSASPATPASEGGRSVFGVPRAGSLAPGGSVRPPSRKGYRQPAHYTRPSPLVPAHANVADTQHVSEGEVPESPNDRSMNLSPQTVDGNPGLVSDHEDDGSASEDEVPQAAIAHSLGVRRRDCTDSMDLDVAVEDDMDEHGVVIRRSSMLAEEHRGLKMAGGSSRK